MLVIGGPIAGTGIALDAGSGGLPVALVGEGDFAAGASGRSQAVYGGQRYL
jgi:glycerol-3-phosphate dehydrogenase